MLFYERRDKNGPALNANDMSGPSKLPDEQITTAPVAVSLQNTQFSSSCTPTTSNKLEQEQRKRDCTKPLEANGTDTDELEMNNGESKLGGRDNDSTKNEKTSTTTNNHEQNSKEVNLAIDEKTMTRSMSTTTTRSTNNLTVNDNNCDIDVKGNSCSTVDDNNGVSNAPTTTTCKTVAVVTPQVTAKRKSLLSKELEEWIWQDNRNFLQDKNIFEHTYCR